MKGKVLRKTLAAALALLLVSGNIPLKPVTDLFSGAAITASAEGETSGQCGENATWELDLATHTLTISGTGKMNDYEYDDRPWFTYKADITSVVIENGITSIGNSSFGKFSNLTSVSIPDSVKSIGADAFYGCESLSSITIPDSVTSIGDSAFRGCTVLTSITIPDGVTSIGSLTFDSCEGLKSIEIPDSVTSIGDYAFSDCTGLTSIRIPDGVTSIGKDAFCGCTGITDVYCFADPDKLTWNEDGCDDFMGAPESRKTVCHVPKNYYLEYVKKFGAESKKPVNVTFDTDAPHGQCGDHAYWLFDPDTHKLTISGTGAMYEYGGTMPWNNYIYDITSVVIENGITSIGNSAFISCAKLTSVSIPDSVKSIGENAFYLCIDLTSITIPDSVESIGDRAFQACTSLTSITIPAGVTSIGNRAFEECSRLESAVIGNSVESIGDRAFFNCTSLTSITIPDSVTSIGKDAFCGCTGITDVYCYADPANLKWNEDGCDDFIKTPKHTTVCHVPAEYLDTYNSEKFSDVNVTFVGDLVDMGLGEHLYGHSITLDGSIGVNFYVELTGELLASDTAAMVFTVPSGNKTETQNLLVKDVIAQGSNRVVIGGKTYYKFKCSVSAKDMASTITAQLVDGEKSGDEYTYSVKDYADYLLKHTDVAEYANAAQLVKTMLSYGAYSQKLFGEGTPLADSYKGDVSGVDIPATFKYNAVKTILPDGVTLEGATLSLKSETTLSLYFKGLPQDTKFTCAGKTVETAKNGEYVIARIRGIKADELESSFTVTFTGGSVEYSPMTYCYNVLKGGSTDGNLQNVCKALYQYAQAAKAYFGEGAKDENEPDF